MFHNIILDIFFLLLGFRALNSEAFVPEKTRLLTTNIRRGMNFQPHGRYVASPLPSMKTTIRQDTKLNAKRNTAKSAMDSSVVASIKASAVTFVLRVSKELQALNTFQRFLFGFIFVLGIYFGKTCSISVRRYKEAIDIPTKYFGPKAPTLTGRVVSVSDGDTLRFYHTPTPFHKSTLSKTEKVSEHSIPIRLCTIDTPETPKFGKPGQPFGKEAKEKLQGLVDGKKVQIRLLSKDQYGRAVGQVFQPTPLPGLGKCVDEIMLESGLAEVYTGMGAVYGPKGKDAYLALESKAQAAKKGIWSQNKRESAAEYKKRTKE